MGVKEFLNKQVAIVFKGGGEILGMVLSVLEEEIELKLLDSDEISEIKINDIAHIEGMEITVKKRSTRKVSGKEGFFIEVNGKKIKKKRPPVGALWSYKSPQEGGCWFCYIKDDELVFDGEFDTHVHTDCIEKALAEDPGHPEALLMKYLLHEKE